VYPPDAAAHVEALCTFLCPRALAHENMRQADLHEVTKIINHTWSLIKDMPNAKQMFANGSGLGSSHNYLFKKMLVRKPGEVWAFPCKFNGIWHIILYDCGSHLKGCLQEIKGDDDDDDLENEAPNIPPQSTDTA